MDEATAKYELNVKILETLRDKELVQALGYGCHLMLVGEAPRKLPEGKTISTRITLDEKSWGKWEQLQKKMPEIPKAMLVTTALALVQEIGARRARL